MDITARAFSALPAWTARRVRADADVLTDTAVLDLVTVAFNNESVVKWQIELLARNLRDPYLLTVVDNSSKRRKRRLIREVCDTAGVGYLGLPSRLLAGADPSTSHGHALNWAYHRHIKARGAAWFGFLDHDIFPIRPTRVVDAVERGGTAWGLIQERAERWYLWPGFCFFSRAAVGRRELNFLPVPGLDTGGANWNALFHEIDRTKLDPLEHTYSRGGDAVGPVQQSSYELIGDWVHTFNASNWMNTGNKDDEIARTLESLSEE